MFALAPAILDIHGFKLSGEACDQWLQVTTPIALVTVGAFNYHGEKCSSLPRLSNIAGCREHGVLVLIGDASPHRAHPPVLHDVKPTTSGQF
jgi:hypothetical protein